MLQLNKDKGLSRLISSYIRALFDERNVPDAMRDKLWAYYYDKLSKGLDVGYNPKIESYDAELARRLKYDIAQFSAFKETAFKKQLEKSLVKNGKLLVWSDFKKVALEVSGLYNVNHLQTEYNHTVATANMAGKWQDFQESKDLYPNLRYEAVNDDRTRQKHKDWDGFVAPIDHPIWKTMYPPNDWGCRCDVVQTDEPVDKNLPKVSNKETFNNNAALSGKIFNDVPYEAGLSVKEKNDAKNLAKQMFNTEAVALVLKRYSGIGFKKIPNIKNKGVLEVFNTGRQSKKEFKGNKNALTILANQGLKYKMLPIINDGMPNPDGFNKMKKHFVDVKVATGKNGKNIVQSSLKVASKQGASEVVIHLTNKPDSYRDMYEALRHSIEQNRNKNIQFITVIFTDGSVKQYIIEEIRAKIDKGKTSN